MNCLKYLIMLLFMISCSVLSTDKSFAQNEENKATEEVKVNLEGQIVLDTIIKLEKEGYLTQRNSKEAQKKYVYENKEYMSQVHTEQSKVKSVDNDVSLFEYLTIVNALKFLGVVLFIIAFFKYIKGVMIFGFYIVKSIPVYVYQFVLICGSIIGIIKPDLLVSQDHFYVAFLSSFVLLISLGWVIAIYEVVQNIIDKLSMGMQEKTFSLLMVLYFGGLSFMYSSQAFGFLSIAALITLFGFVVFQSRLTFYIGVQEDKYISPVILSTLLIIGVYSFLKVSGIDFHQENFRIGVEYLCSFALGSTLLIAGSPYSPRDYKAAGIIGMIVISVLSFVVGTIYDLSVISAFINTFFVLWLVIWISWIGLKINGIVALAFIGASLYGIGLLIEKVPEYFVTSLL